MTAFCEQSSGTNYVSHTLQVICDVLNDKLVIHGEIGLGLSLRSHGVFLGHGKSKYESNHEKSALHCHNLDAIGRCSNKQKCTTKHYNRTCVTLHFVRRDSEGHMVFQFSKMSSYVHLTYAQDVIIKTIERGTDTYRYNQETLMTFYSSEQCATPKATPDRII